MYTYMHTNCCDRFFGGNFINELIEIFHCQAIIPTRFHIILEKITHFFGGKHCAGMQQLEMALYKNPAFMYPWQVQNAAASANEANFKVKFTRSKCLCASTRSQFFRPDFPACHGFSTDFSSGWGPWPGFSHTFHAAHRPATTPPPHFPLFPPSCWHQLQLHKECHTFATPKVKSVDKLWSSFET